MAYDCSKGKVGGEKKPLGELPVWACCLFIFLENSSEQNFECLCWKLKAAGLQGALESRSAVHSLRPCSHLHN